MSLLLDSHIILWWLEESPRLTPLIRKTIATANGDVFVSYATMWEFAVKTSTGKLRIDIAAFHRNVTQDGFQWLAISPQHIELVATLPNFDDHRDPFDRLLVAQSLSEPLILLTTDAKLGRYGTTVRVV